MNQEEFELYAELQKIKTSKVHRIIRLSVLVYIIILFIAILSSCNKETTVNQPDKEVMVKTTVIDNDGVEHDSQVVIVK